MRYDDVKTTTRPWRTLVAVLVLSLLAATGCKEDVQRLLGLGTAYQVVFQEDPALSTDGIFLKGVQIGEVTGRSIGESQAVVADIEIQAKYVDLMREGAVFVVRSGRLEYESAQEGGKPLPEGARVLGFGSQGDYLRFRAESGFSDFMGKTMDMLDEMLKPRQPEKAPPPPPAPGNGKKPGGTTDL